MCGEIESPRRGLPAPRTIGHRPSLPATRSGSRDGDHARVLSDIELEVLTGDLDHLAVIDSDVTDGSRLLDDVGVTVLDARTSTTSTSS